MNCLRGRRKSFVVPETIMIHLGWGGGGGRGCEPKSQVDRHCTYDMYFEVHACDFHRPAKKAVFVSEGGERIRVRNERCSFQGRQKTFTTTP